MALANLNSIQFYQPPIKASLSRERVLKASNAKGPLVVGEEKPPKAPRPSGGWSALWDSDPIDFINMTDSPPREYLSPFRDPVPDLKDTEADAGDTSNGLCNTGDLDHGISEDHDDLLTLEELLLDAGEIRKSEQAGWSREYEEVRLEYATEKDCGGVTSPKSRRGKDTDTLMVLDDDHSQGGDTEPVKREVDSSSAIHPSDGWISEEKGRNQSSPSTPPTSVASSEIGCPTLHEKSENVTPKPPPPRRDSVVSLANNTPTCELTERGSSTGKTQGDRWNDKEAEADDKVEEEEELDGDNDENSPPLLRPAVKRCRSTAGEKSSRKRGMKRRRFSSPLSSDEETEMGDESDISSYVPSRPHHPLNPRSTSSHSTGFKGDTSDGRKMELAGGRSWMAIIYEQQSWEGEIVDERDIKKGRGRPRKQYLVRWKSSWMDGGRLTAPGLVESWKEQKAPKPLR